MKRIHLTICLALFSLLMTSCGKEEPFAPADNATPLELCVVAENFVSTNETTRAADAGYVTTFTANDQIGIFAVKASNGFVLDKNIPYKYNGTAWVPVDDTNTVHHYNYLDDVTYFAYYPYSVDMDDATSEDGIVDKFTPLTDQSTYANYTKSDLMTGTGTISLIDGKPVLTFQLAHRMSLLVIYPRGQHYQTTDGYDFYAPPKDITTLEVGSITSAYQPGDCTLRAIVPPGAVDVTISYVTTEDVTLQYRGTASTTAGKFTKIELAPASPALSYSISVGDYFFSDGGLLPAAEALAEVNIKNCIGLLFYVGKHALDSGAYTDKSGAPMDVHGYVIVAAPKAYSCAWGSQETDIPDGVGTSLDTDDFMGYYNTQKIKDKALLKHPELVATSGLSTEATNNYPATYHATITIEQDCPSPISCSGWFLPSFGQLSAVRSQEDILTDNLVKLGRNNFFNGNYTWTSTEYMMSGEHRGKHAYGYNLSNGGQNSAGKSADWYSLIAVLAF